MKIDSRMESRISLKAEQHTLKIVEYDDKSMHVDMLSNDYGTKEGMPSIGKPIADEKSAVVTDVTNDIDLDITTCRIPRADENLASGVRNECEAEVDDLSCVKDIADDNAVVTGKFKQSHEVHTGILISESIQECSHNLPCSTSMKCASLAKKKEILNGRVGIAYGSGICVCLPVVDQQAVRDITVDKQDTAEDKLPLCSDCNISVEKLSNVVASSISGSYRNRGNLESIYDQMKAVEVEDKLGRRFRSKDCHPEEQGLLGLVVKGLMEDVLPFSAMNTTEDNKGMLDETFILDLPNAKDNFDQIFHERNKIVEWPGNSNVQAECNSRSVTLSSQHNDEISEFLASRGEGYSENTLVSSISKSINCLDVRLESSKESKALSADCCVGTTLHMPDDLPFSRRYRPNEVDLSSCEIGINSIGITCNVNCADEFENSLVKGAAIKDRDCCPHLSSLEIDINENAGLDSTTMFQLQTNSLSVSEEERAQVALDLVRETVVTEHLSGEVSGSVTPEEMTMKTSEGAEHGRISASESYMDKPGSLTSGSTNSSISETYARSNISTCTLAGNEATANGENERQMAVGQSVLAGHPIGQSHSLEMEQNISTQGTAQILHETVSDVCDKASGNNDVADTANNIYSGAIPLSGSISYSGAIPYSGSVSLRSDSSTTSTHSFAFPILASEWNSSPVKMARADSRFFKKKRCWHFCFFCCRS